MTSLFNRVHALTGFDADKLTAHEECLVLVTGPPGSGASSLVAACRSHNEGLRIEEYTPDLAAKASVAVFLVDPSSAMDEDDYVLLSTLRAQVGIVALVCARIDAFWEWPRILRAARAYLDPRQQLPLFATSSAACLAGAVDESGVDELVDWFAEEFAAPPAQRLRQARIAAARGAVDHALDSDPSESELTVEIVELSGRRKEIVAGRERGRADRLSALRTGLNRARTDAHAEVTSDLRELSTAATGRCAEMDRSELSGERIDGYVGWLRGEVQKVAARGQELVDKRLTEVEATILVGTDGAGGANSAERRPAHARPDPSPDAEAEAEVFTRRPPPEARRNGEDALLVLLGASTGLGVGRLIVTPMEQVATLQWISMPVTLLLGVAVAAWVIRARRATLRRQQLRGWTNETLTQVRSKLEQRISARIAATESQITGIITRHHERRTRSAADAVTGIDDRLAALRASEARLTSRRQQLVALQEALDSADLPERTRDTPGGTKSKTKGTEVASAASKES